MNWASASGSSSCRAALRDRVGSLPLVIAKAPSAVAGPSLAVPVPGCLIQRD
jgi:hypothetical protein